MATSSDWGRCSSIVEWKEVILLNTEKITAGIVLIGIGLIVLLANLGIITWLSLTSIFNLWPLLLIVAGINIIFKRNRFVAAGTWILFFAVLISYSYYNIGGINTYSEASYTRVQLNKPAELRTGELKIDFGGAIVDIKGTNRYLIDADYAHNMIRFTNNFSDQERHGMMKFEPVNQINWLNTSRQALKYQIDLHEEVLWDIKADMGAVSGVLDFSNVKLKNLDLDVGAGNLTLIFASNTEDTYVKLDAGASKVDLILKDDVGAKIKIDGLLSKTNVEALGWTKSGEYLISPNYDDADSKLFLDIDVGVGKLNIIEQK